MRRAPSVKPNTAGLVEKYIGSFYDVVSIVAGYRDAAAASAVAADTDATDAATSAAAAASSEATVNAASAAAAASASSASTSAASALASAAAAASSETSADADATTASAAAASAAASQTSAASSETDAAASASGAASSAAAAASSASSASASAAAAAASAASIVPAEWGAFGFPPGTPQYPNTIINNTSTINLTYGGATLNWVGVGPNRTPLKVELFFICLTAEYGYAVGNILQIAPGIVDSASQIGITIRLKNKEVSINFGAGGSTLIEDLTDNQLKAPTPANWGICARVLL